MGRKKQRLKKGASTPQNIQTASHGMPFMYWGMDEATQIVSPTDGRGWIQRYSHMVDTDTITRAFVTVLQLLMISLTFEIQSSEDDEGDERQEMAKCLFMQWESGDFKDFLRNYVSTMVYGFSLFELVLRKDEQGYAVDDLVFHPQKYLTAKFADQFTLEGFDSMLTQGTIPLSQCVYAVGMGNFDHNVYGQSLLRSAYFHFKNKCFYLTKENRQAQINLEGVPVFTVDNSGDAEQTKANFARIAAQAINYKNGQSYGLILGSKTYRDSDGKPSSIKCEDVRLMSVEGSKFIDTDALVRREENAIARALLAEFLVLVGQDSGSYALGKETTSMFKLLVEGMAQNLCDTFNHQVIKPLWVLNGQDLEMVPKLTYDSVDLTLDGMATFISALSGAGVTLTKSQEDYLFSYGGLPKPTVEERLEQEANLLMMQSAMTDTAEPDNAE